LARLDEETFRNVKKVIYSKIESFTNWNEFAYTLLQECHNQYKVPEYEDWHDNYGDVSDDFEDD
jgi:hypothetical protein